MRFSKLFISSTLILALTGIYTSCKKNNDKKANCRIASLITNPGANVYTFLYNNESKLIRTALGNSVITYDYSGNTTTIINLDSGKFLNKSIVTNNADGLAINVRTESNSAGTDWNNTFYEYTGVELARSTFTSSAGGSAVTTYTWVNQNLVAAKTDTTTSTLEYYPDKPRQAGDFLSLIQTVQGYEIYRNKNLIKMFQGTNLNYIFGADGKINSLEAASPASTAILDYQYQCN
jgi:hypothetical protein